MVGETARLRYDDGFYKRARRRYIRDTTGPLAMQRFLRDPGNQEWRDIISYFQCSTAEEGDTATLKDLDKYDVVSATSNT